MNRPLPRQKAAKLVERAQALFRDGAFADAAALLQEAVPRLSSPEAEVLLVRCLGALGRKDEALAALEHAHRRFPKEPAISVQLGLALAQAQEHGRAASAFRAGEAALRNAPELLALYASTLLQLGQGAEALKPARRAAELNPSNETRVLLCLAQAASGSRAEAVVTALALTGTDALVDSAREVGARCALAAGDIEHAVELWSHMADVPPSALASFALALELKGEPKRADAALAKAPADPATKLFAARIALNRRELARALELLEGAEPGNDVTLTRARALRLLGRLDEAAAEIQHIASPHGFVLTERAHVLAEQRQFDLAQADYEAALKEDPENLEAQQGLSLTRRQLSWRQALEQRTLEQAEASQLEVATLKRLLAARQRELEAAQQMLARAPKPKDAEGALTEALGSNRGRLPEAVWATLVEAEKTEAPRAAAILFLGALERLLHVLLVERFTLEPAERDAFLKGAVRERRGGKSEYFDRFVQAFDPMSADRSPALGEQARALSRRGLDYLAPFARHLERTFSLDAAALDALAKELERLSALRNELVHGHADGFAATDLLALRRALLERGGVFVVLLTAVRDV
jgi:tetratricopeptide (TPR) repeat protein